MVRSVRATRDCVVFVQSTSHVMSSVWFELSTPSDIHSPPKMSRNSQKDLGSDGPVAIPGTMYPRSALVSTAASIEIWHPFVRSSDS